MKAELAQVRSGAISFDAFARRTLPRWRRLAANILRRWSCGAGADVEDVTQELLLSAWRALPKYDPSRGVDVERFVVWQASNDAKNWVHGQRGVGSGTHGRDHLPSVRVYSLTEHDADAEVKAAQEEIVACLQRMRLAIDIARSPQQAMAIQAVAYAGSIDGAADSLSGVMSRRKIQEALHDVARRMAV